MDNPILLFCCTGLTSMPLPGMRCIDFFGEYGHVVAYDQIPYGLSEKLVEGDWAEDNPYSSNCRC